MSLFSRPSTVGSSGSGGGLTPEQYAALVQDPELAAVRLELLTDIPALVTSRTQECINATHSVANGIQAAVATAGLPIGFVAEFPANAVHADYSPIQGSPTELPTGFGTAGVSRATGANGVHRGFAATESLSRLWSLYGTTLAAVDTSINRNESATYTLPVTPSTGYRSAVLHDLSTPEVLITVGVTAAGLGSPASYVFDAQSRVFTQGANFSVTTADGFVRAGAGGTTLRLADGRTFWFPSELWRTTLANSIVSNMHATDGGYYFLYDPVAEVATAHRFANWAAVMAGVALAEAGAPGIHSALPVGQLPDGRVVVQELATNLSTSRHFLLNLAAGSITVGTGYWSGAQWALASHPQGLTCFAAGSTPRRYFNGQTLAMDPADAQSYSITTVTGSSQGHYYKALPLGNGNYALPAANGTTQAFAFAFDTYARLGTVKARKTR